MSPILAPLAPCLYDMALRLPLAWRSSRRRRRFTLLGLCAPGYVAIVTLPFHKNAALLCAGVVTVLVAVQLRRLTEPFFLAAEGDPDGPLAP